jgi:hypothetical protein
MREGHAHAQGLGGGGGGVARTPFCMSTPYGIWHESIHINFHVCSAVATLVSVMFLVGFVSLVAAGSHNVGNGNAGSTRHRKLGGHVFADKSMALSPKIQVRGLVCVSSFCGKLTSLPQSL